MNLTFSRRTDCLPSLIFVKHFVRMQTLTHVCWASSLLGGKIAANPGSTWQEGKHHSSVLDSSLARRFSMPPVRPSAVAVGVAIGSRCWGSSPASSPAASLCSCCHASAGDTVKTQLVCSCLICSCSPFRFCHSLMFVWALEKCYLWTL